MSTRIEQQEPKHTQCPFCKKHLLQRRLEIHFKDECEKLKQKRVNISDIFKNDFKAENGSGLKNIERDRAYWNSFAGFFKKGLC
ncbi:hypothetical protein FC093_22165 [Ilyomonas limi]|jgi:hypothetical protein|uniref:Uncharacterized protein n=1 Tax=Ilyomonas limi TaxID=2575867 RepID=A0A4U3KU80_9BACT|nr:hypothetical protein [Ilyomonas limi]TKK64577.1 hypothetical protein FC093_22165 [Ilyomonas limi]